MFVYQTTLYNSMLLNTYMNYLMPFMNFQYNNYQRPDFNSVNQNPIRRRLDLPVLKERLNIQPERSTTTEKMPDPQKRTVKITTAGTEKELEQLLKQNKYNKNKGELLAKNVVEGLPAYRDPENPLCARYVKNAIVKSGLGPYINGNGEYCKYILRANDNFKEIKVKGNVLEALPVGSIVVYDAFTPCIDAKGEANQIGKDGHVLIMIGDKKGCSDIIEDRIPLTDNAYVFIPV